MARLAHLRDDVEVGRHTRIGEDDGGEGSKGTRGIGGVEKLPVGDEGARLGCC